MRKGLSGGGLGECCRQQFFFLLERKKYLDDVAVVADDACLSFYIQLVIRR